jgi:acetyl esterase/lipase
MGVKMWCKPSGYIPAMQKGAETLALRDVAPSNAGARPEDTMTNWTQLDPALFSEEAIAADTRAVIETVEKVMGALPPTETRDPKELREERRKGGGSLPLPPLSDQAVMRTITGAGGEIPLRVIAPENPEGCFLYLHGGGWTLGSADGQDPLLEAVAKHANLACISVDYRLAPEDPYPAGPDDCEAAALWLAENAQAEWGTSRLLIGGASAGAHLSAVTLLRMRDKHGTQPFCGASLTYGAYDLNMTPSMRNWGERPLILTTPLVDWFCNNFLPPKTYDAKARMDPDISPIYADLSDMPPAHFLVGTLDPLIDDSLFMYGRWTAAGNEAVLDIAPGGIHGFNAFPCELTTEMNAKAVAFLASTGK